MSKLYKSCFFFLWSNCVERLPEIVIQNVLVPHLNNISFRLPFSLFSILTIFIINIKPPPLSVSCHISSKLVKLDLLLPMTTIYKSSELRSTFVLSKNTLSNSTLFKSLSCFPTFSSCDFICIICKCIFFDTSNNI